jgi:hypothetical protein
VVACGHCSVPLDCPNVPRSTSGRFRRFRHFRHFKQLLRSFFEVKKKKILCKEATNASWTVSIRIMFSSAHDAKTNASRVVNGLEICRTKQDATADLQTTP